MNDTENPWLSETSDGWRVRIRVIPRSSRNAFGGLVGQELKVKLTSPPVDGKANNMCLNFMAKNLGLTKRDIEIVSGLASRSKVLAVRCGRDRKPHVKRLLEGLQETRSP